ncbi:mevalonate kinase [Flavobacteriaceae bacterium UJ101]|nr:mevalonate kinase [Flavobacteriaceae bacterium UJ101]
MRNPLFYAKVLLFGEYGIIENSKGLTIPLNFYKGTLKYDKTNQNAITSNGYLVDFASYLNQLQKEPSFPKFNLTQLHQDLEKGMFFDSDIPQGYGVGSSGALVAAIYDQYVINKIDIENINKEEIKQLKHIFSKMESHFHGTSSGIDPLICYLNIPLLINSKDDISTIGIPKSNGKGAVFLLNSGTPGETEPMVNIFFEKLKNQGFRKTLKQEFIKYNDACIDAFVKGDKQPLFNNLKALSSWALIHFRPMIPKSILKLWEQGLETNSYYLKLCGSGGGGYILGFAEDYEKAQSLLKNYHPEIVYRF